MFLVYISKNYKSTLNYFSIDCQRMKTTHVNRVKVKILHAKGNKENITKVGKIHETRNGEIKKKVNSQML